MLANRAVPCVVSRGFGHPKMSDGQIAAILRALGSSKTHHSAADESRVRPSQTDVQPVASNSPAEAGLAYLTPVPQRLLDLKVDLSPDAESEWWAASELSTIKSSAR